MSHSRRTVLALIEHLERHERLVEVGVGRRSDVAAGLADRGRTVTATDVHERSVPEGVRFVLDDVTDPDEAVYAGADALYALNLPPELHRPLVALAERVNAACYFTTLGADQPAVPVDRTTLPGETLYTARNRDV